MSKNKLDYKLLNICILALIVYLVYQTGNLWIGVIGRLTDLLFPIFLAFVIAYALYPFLNFMMNHKIPKALGVMIIIVIIVGIIAIMGITLAPMLFNQLNSLFNGIMAFVKQLSVDFDFEIGSIQTSLSEVFNNIITSVGKYVSNSAVNLINISLSVISKSLICFAVMIYFLVDMDKIREEFKTFLRLKSNKVYSFIRELDHEMRSYLSGLIRVMIISFFEYGICYKIIGHPNAILLGFLACISGLIPYFGGIMTNIVAAITAFVVSPALFIRTVITFAVLSAVDSYVINPLVYGKTNDVHPLIVIISIFIGGSLFGVIGIMASFPLAVACITSYKFFKDDVMKKFEEMKSNSKKEKNKEN